MRVRPHSVDYPPIVDQVLLECQPIIHQDVDQVLINMSIKGINQEY